MSNLGHRSEQTGNAALDRIQSNVRNLVEYVRTLARSQPTSIWLKEDFTTTSATAQSTKLTCKVEPGDILNIEGWLRTGVSGDALGMSYTFGAPSDTEISGSVLACMTATNDLSFVSVDTINTATIAVHTVNGGSRSASFNVRIRVFTKGDFTVRAHSTTATRTTTIKAKSLMRVTRVNEEAA